MDSLTKKGNRGDSSPSLWRTIFLQQRSLPLQILIQILIGVVGMGLSAAIYYSTGLYAGSVTIAVSASLAIFGNLYSSIFIATLLALAVDYWFIPPIGSVLTTREGIEHLMIVIAVAIPVCLSIQSIKNAYKALDRAKADEEAAKLRAEEARQAMEKALAIVSHDIRNPLGSIKLSAEMITRLDKESPKAANLAQRTLVTLNRVDRIIGALLDVSRLRSGRSIQLQFANCDLRDILRETVDEFSFRRNEGKSFELLLPSTPVFGCWSREGLQRAFENLISNALKYGAQGMPVEIKLEVQQDRARICVHNFGKVIPSDELPNLFDAFQRASTSGPAQGWGLGLAIVKGIAEAHEGTVRVESHRLEGTSFTLELPIQQMRAGSQNITPLSLSP